MMKKREKYISLRRLGWSQTAAAKKVGIGRTTAWSYDRDEERERQTEGRKLDRGDAEKSRQRVADQGKTKPQLRAEQMAALERGKERRDALERQGFDSDEVEGSVPDPGGLSLPTGNADVRPDLEPPATFHIGAAFSPGPPPSLNVAGGDGSSWQYDERPSGYDGRRSLGRGLNIDEVAIGPDDDMRRMGRPS